MSHPSKWAEEMWAAEIAVDAESFVERADANGDLDADDDDAEMAGDSCAIHGGPLPCDECEEEDAR